MGLKSLLLSSEEKTVRVLRRVLSDLDIDLEDFAASTDVIRRITRHRFEAIIVDCSDPEDAGNVLSAAKAAPANKRALLIVLVESQLGLKGGFDMGAHFVLHKPLTVERAKSSFRAVRALMKSERRAQLRIPIQVPVDCVGSAHYKARSLDLSEGGMALQFLSRKSKESVLRFNFKLPGLDQDVDIWGEVAWEANGVQAGVRFKDLSAAQRNQIREWLNSQLPESERDDPPVVCRVVEFSSGGCYLTTCAPFPKSTRVALLTDRTGRQIRVSGIVRLAHPEFGMGVEFLRSTPEQQEQLRGMIEILRSSVEAPQLQVEPEGLEATFGEQAMSRDTDDVLLTLFRDQAQLPAKAFLEHMQQL